MECQDPCRLHVRTSRTGGDGKPSPCLGSNGIREMRSYPDCMQAACPMLLMGAASGCPQRSELYLAECIRRKFTVDRDPSMGICWQADELASSERVACYRRST